RVETTARWIGEQAHVRISRRPPTDLLEQVRQHGAPQATSLVLRQNGHVDDVEIPASVADETAHRNGTSFRFVDDVTGCPASRDRAWGLPLGLRGKPRSQPQVEIVGGRGSTVSHGVAARERGAADLIHTAERTDLDARNTSGR